MSDLSDALADAEKWFERGITLMVDKRHPIVTAARLVSEAPEWLQRLLEDGYHIESPTLGDVILLKVPPNSEDILDLAEALRDALDR